MAVIGITYDLKGDWKRADNDPEDINAEFDKLETLQRIITALENGGHRVEKIGNVDKLLKQIDDLSVDIVFNVCEGRSGRNRESQVPVLLEMKGIPYVGGDGLTLAMTLDKIIAKKLFISENIPTPRFFEVKNVGDITKLKTIDFPLIVKTRHEGSSKGISQKSRVEDMDALKRQVALINTAYDQPALVEEFIRGTEFTVAVLGNEEPQAMPVVQISIDGKVQLGDEFYTHERISSDKLQYICPAEISNELRKKIQDMAVRVYNCVECRDFGRVDFRVNEQGDLYVLEINPLPSLDVLDVFNIFPNVMGSDYDGVINQVVDFALQRYGILNNGSLGDLDLAKRNLEHV